MSQAASQAAAFYRDVAKNKKMWTVRDEEGFFLYGERGTMPLWSTLSRAKKMASALEALNDAEIVEISWEEFRDEWVPKLTKGDHLVGVNWSGSRGVGYDIEPERLRETVQVHIDNEYF